MQIEAPSTGGPTAVELARSLKIHIWAAKNAPEGWIAHCPAVADRRKVPVLFCVGDEEYGSYQKVAGLGSPATWPLLAPSNVDFGAMIEPGQAGAVAVFRDQRIADVRKARGCMIWQFNENEELTRVLDEAVETGTYAAISSFHFGNEHFPEHRALTMRYQDVLPFVALQDCHSIESWWWADQLAGFRTVFLARDRAAGNRRLEALHCA